MKFRAAFALALGAMMITACQVKETEDAEGDSSLQVEPAPVEIGTDTTTMTVPDVDVGTDTTPATTTH